MVPRLTAIVVACCLCTSHAWAQTAPTSVEVADGSGGAGSATPAEVASQVQYALNAFVYGAYDDVISRLRPLLLGAHLPQADRSTLISGLGALGVSAHFRGDGALADEAFLTLLKLEPEYSLDPLLYPAAVIARFDEVRRTHADLLRPAAAGGAPVYIEARVTERAQLGYALPFGAGFLANGDTTTGGTYLTAEVLLGAASVGLYLKNEAERRPDGFFDDPNSARVRRTAQIWTGAGFFVVLAVNVVHGLLTKSGADKVEYRALPGPPAGLGPTTSLGGFGLSWNMALP